MRQLSTETEHHSVCDERVIRIHAAAPPKPPANAPCNGCGACCIAEPCPVSRFLLGHRNGPCPALDWQTSESRYRCGMIVAPAQYLRWMPFAFSPLASRLAMRWVAAGSGCDFDADVT